MDWTTIGLFAFLVLSYAAIGLAVYLVMREDQPKRQIKRRFYALVRRRPQWCCVGCHSWYYGKAPAGPICGECKRLLMLYLQEVA